MYIFLYGSQLQLPNHHLALLKSFAEPVRHRRMPCRILPACKHSSDGMCTLFCIVASSSSLITAFAPVLFQAWQSLYITDTCATASYQPASAALEKVYTMLRRSQLQLLI